MICLSVGCFLFRIYEQPGDHLNFPNYWNGYLSHERNNTTATIYIHTMDELKIDICKNGWVYDCKPKVYRVSYYEKGKCFFTIECLKGLDTFYVYNARHLGNSLALALHYVILLSLSNKCVGLHAVTLICGDKVVLLSAPSGTGKTTLSRLLMKYCDAVVINGDFALLHLTERDGVVFEPTPFCGTSKRCINQRLHIDEIVFLEQSNSNCFETLSSRQAIAMMTSNAFIPSGVPEWMEQIVNNIFQIVEKTKISKFSFEPTEEAAVIFFRKLIS